MGTCFSVALLAAVPLQATHAQSAPACAAAWNAATAYGGGSVVSENGNNYLANWWTQGNEPATSSGPGGSGQPWTSQGSCGGSTPPTDPPPTEPPPQGLRVHTFKGGPQQPNVKNKGDPPAKTKGRG
jgi:chitodextrinase